MDLSKFKKVASDGKTSTFRHYEGHELKVAHSKLSSKLRGQLESMPVHKPKMKEQKFAYAGEVEDDQGQGAAYRSAYPEQDGPPAPMEVPSDALGSAYATAANAQGVMPSRAPQQTAPAEDSPDAALQGPANMPQPPNPDPTGEKSAIDQQISGIKQVGAGDEALMQAQGQLGTQRAAAAEPYLRQMQDSADAYQAALAPILKDRADISADIANGHIDPHRYLDNMSTGSKIFSALGMIIGGMGAGMGHTQNLAFQSLQNNIDRDIQGQKDDLGRKQTLLSHNLAQSRDLSDAYNVTRVQTNDILAHHLAMLADQTADPMAKANIMKVHGQVMLQTGQLMQNAAQYRMRGMVSAGQSLPSQSIEMLPPEMRERAVQIPGGGVRVALTKDGAKEVRDQMQSIQPIFNGLDQLQKLGPSALVPGTPANQMAKAIQAQLIPTVNSNAGLKRLSSEDIGNIKQMFSDPTKFSGLLSGARTAAFKAFLQNKLMSTMSSQLEGGGGQSAPTGSFGFKPRASK